MNEIEKPEIYALSHVLAQHGIEDIVIAPGSRNAPLIKVFNGNKAFKCYSIADERSAAFFALGLSQISHKPTVVVCTSGSAVLNFYPAVSEAFYQKIPLIILSADRPQEWVDQGDGQTIRQQFALANHVKRSIQLPQNPVSADDHWYFNRLVNEGINASKFPEAGPVHFNIGFPEPLYNIASDKTNQTRKINFLQPNYQLATSDLEQLAHAWIKASKKIILVGQHQPDQKLNTALKLLARNPSVVVLTETLSNIHGSNFLPCIDKVLESISIQEEEQFRPQLLVTIGGAIVSKKIKAFLRRSKVTQHWNINISNPEQDTYKQLTHAIPAHPEQFFAQLLPLVKSTESNYHHIWWQKNEQVEHRHHEFISKAPFSDLKVFNAIMRHLPVESDLQVGNSSAIRYIQLFQNPKAVTNYCNRGTSGIDGSSSTAVGAAYKSEKTTTLITGDISFFYDSNAWWNRYVGSNLKIILINNGGGGIFRIIDGPATTGYLEEYFEAAHTLNAKGIAETFGLNYLSAHTSDGLEDALTKLYSSDTEKAILLEVFTPQHQNAIVLKNYFKHLLEQK